MAYVATSLSQREKLPSEREWCDILNVSRSTVRQALLALETSGHLQRRRGSGWYVSPLPLRYDPCNHVPFTYSAMKQGRKPSWKEVRITKDIPPSEIAKAFRIRSNRKTPVVEVLLELDSDPVALETSYIDPRLCDNPNEINHALPISEELHRISGSTLYYRRTAIRTSSCGGYAAGLIGVHAESPALLMSQWISAEDGSLISICETTWRANALEFVVAQKVNQG